MKLRLNKEFAARHLFVALLMAALGGWFAYDGYVGYPGKSPEALYTEHHNGISPQSEEEAVKYYANACVRQKQFMFLAFLASLIIGGHLFAVSRFVFSFDESSFTFKGAKIPFDAIEKVDSTLWDKKTIFTIFVKGVAIKLDAWHHTGVKDFREALAKAGKIT